MVNDNDLMSQEWCDVIFEKRNKEYGAYTIRTTSSKRYLIAFLAVLLFTLFITFLPALFGTAKGSSMRSPSGFKESIVLADLKDIKYEKKQKISTSRQEAPPPRLKDVPLKKERSKEGVRYGVEGGKPQGADRVEEIPGKQPESPQLNMNALYKGRKSGNGQGYGEGDETGKGTLGVKGGDPNSNYYGGVQGGRGISFNLDGRYSSNLAKPTYSSKDQGTIVVKIWVDRQGHVVKARAGERGTTIYDQQLCKLAEQAALQSSFAADLNAPELQTGSITYKFIMSESSQSIQKS